MSTPEGEDSGAGKHRPVGRGTVEIKEIDSKTEIEKSEDNKEIEIERIRAEAAKARYQTIGRVAVAVAVAIVAALAVVYGRSFSSSLLTIDGDTTTVETKTTGPVAPDVGGE